MTLAEYYRRHGVDWEAARLRLSVTAGTRVLAELAKDAAEDGADLVNNLRLYEIGRESWVVLLHRRSQRSSNRRIRQVDGQQINGSRAKRQPIQGRIHHGVQRPIWRRATLVPVTCDRLSACLGSHERHGKAERQRLLRGIRALHQTCRAIDVFWVQAAKQIHPSPCAVEPR